jgi:dihydropteroate synthase
MRLLSLDNLSDLRHELALVGADAECWDIFAAKREVMCIKVEGFSTAGANIMKQLCLSAGADCAVSRRVASGHARISDGVVFATRRQLESIVARLKVQPECVSRLVPEFERLLAVREAGLFLQVGRKRLDMKARTYVMGILNVTPDSFSDGGRFIDPGAAVAHAVKMAEEGADFIDVGAESTRPGAASVSPREQIARLKPVLAAVRRRVKAAVSVDTTSARVAEFATGEGAQMVNDVSGFWFDVRMAKTVAKSGVACVVMHMQGVPKTMQRAPLYRDLMADVTAFLVGTLERGRKAGIGQEKFVVDPGIGFGKDYEHNLEILRRLRELRSLGVPVMVGPSRKRFIGKALGLDVSERLEGTLAVCVVAALNGANILRVHDVKAAKRALKLADAIAGRC